MEKWQYISLLLCAYGFFKKIRPSEPYDVKYLVDYKNFTREVIIQQAFPVSTYTWFATLPLVFLFTSLVRYRPIIYIEAISIVSIFVLMIWGQSMATLLTLEALYGVAVSAEVAYQTYIYAKVDKEHFQKVTSYIYSATYLGTFASAVISQVLVSFELMSLLQLNYLSLGGVSIAFVICLFLPAVPKSDIFETEDDGLSLIQRVKPVATGLLKDFRAAYFNPYVLKWCIWWSVEKAMNFQVVTYHKSLLDAIDPGANENQVYNGALQAVQCGLSVSLSIGIAHLTIPWKKWGVPCVILVSFVQGVALLALSQMTSVFPAYALILAYRTSHQVTVTIASSEVAKNINPDSHGLIFGFNVFVAAGLQVLITLIVSSDNGLALDIKPQYLVYGGYNIVLGIFFIILSIFSFCFRKAKPKSKLRISVATDDAPFNEEKAMYDSI